MRSQEIPAEVLHALRTNVEYCAAELPKQKKLLESASLVLAQYAATEVAQPRAPYRSLYIDRIKRLHDRALMRIESLAYNEARCKELLEYYKD